jgi:hypothetical protein
MKNKISEVHNIWFKIRGLLDGNTPKELGIYKLTDSRNPPTYLFGIRINKILFEFAYCAKEKISIHLEVFTPSLTEAKEVLINKLFDSLSLEEVYNKIGDKNFDKLIEKLKYRLLELEARRTADIEHAKLVVEKNHKLLLENL